MPNGKSQLGTKGSLRRRLNSASVSNVCEATPSSLFWGLQWIQRITWNAFWISFHPDWQIHKAYQGAPKPMSDCPGQVEI